MKVKNIQKAIILLFTAIIALFAVTIPSKATSSEVSNLEEKTLNKNEYSKKSENTTINTYLNVMADYSEEEVNEFFALRNVTDDTVIFAPENSKGGFFLFEGDDTTVVSENEGVVTAVDAKAPNQSATVGEVKEALKESNS